MECKHQLARRGDSWGGSTTTTSSTLHDSQAKKSLEETRFRERVPEMFSTSIFEKNDQCGVKVKPGLTPCQMERKTNLSRSASLSEKELKEARAKSQIIAAQLQADSNSKGVQLFNRRRQRVNAFTLVSIGGQRENVIDSSSGKPLALDKYNSVETQQSKTGFSGSAAGLYRCPAEMDETGDTAHEDVADAIREERHFLPVNEKDDEVSEDLMEDLKDEFIASDNITVTVLDRACQDDPEANGTHSTSIDTNKEDIVNGYSMQLNGTVANAVTKQTSTINRTARPFFSPITVEQSDSTNPARYIPPAPSYKFPEPPTTAYSNPEPYNKQNYPFPQPTRQSFSPPPPPPSYPTPPLPLPPPSAPVNTSSGQTSSCYIRPSEPRPTFVSELLNEQRSVTPIRTGILDEGRVRRSSRKSMFTFQEKPKLAPNPELLSLVQGADEKKKHKTQPEPAHEEELLALGAEASNFLPKEEGVHEEALVPEWASSLKSSRTRARMEHKPEQALTNASGKGAELFAKRQSRMERYDKEQVRSPSPTMSLPPSWIYPSNMPGRVKAIVNTSNISAQITKSLHAQQATQKKATTKMQASVPPPAPEVPLENGCTKIEMELSKHQPYQINSSLFILNPSKDPYCTLPRAAKSGYTMQTSLPTSPLPSPYTPSATLRSSHCFSPPMTPLCPISAGPISSPIPPSQERVASPRSVAHVPRPSFSAKKAGITPQKNPETQAANSNPVSTAPPFITHNLSRRYTSPDVTSSNVWSIGSQLMTPSSSSSSNHIYKPTPISPSSQPIHKTIMTYSSPSPSPKPAASPGSIFKPATTSPVSPSWDSRCQSPAVTQDIKANHRILAKNIINAAKRKNSPSPSNSRSLPISPVSPSIVPYEHKSLSPFQPRMLGAQSPTIISPTRLIPSPVRLYNTRSLTDSDASVESEDSGLRSPGARSYNTCPRGWTGGLQVKRGSVPEDL